MEMNFCRRCGAPLEAINKHTYRCKTGHTLFANASPAAGIWIINERLEVLVTERSRDPGRGKLDAPGGFNDGAETFEHALERELEEELGLKKHSYTTPQLLGTYTGKYPYGGEVRDVVTAMYWATIIGSPTITPQDDVASVHFIPIEKVDINLFHFTDAKESFIVLRKMLLSSKTEFTTSKS